MRTAEERAAYEAVHEPVFLPPSLYAAAERQWIDMTGYRISKPIPHLSGDENPYISPDYAANLPAFEVDMRSRGEGACD